MHQFSLPAKQYRKLLDINRVSKFSKIHVYSKLFGHIHASLFLRTTPIEGVALYVSSPSYSTNISSYYPVYLGKIVMLGYLIVPKHSDSEFHVTDTKTVVRRKCTNTETFEKGFSSKQMLMLKSKSANLFIPAIKYEN